MTKTRPIIFSAPMVRAILDGRKTQTRRIVKPQPQYIQGTVAPQQKRGEHQKHPAPYFDAYNHGPFWCWWDEYDRQGNDWIKCPYGKPGDRLWVRETWKPTGLFAFSKPKETKGCGKFSYKSDPDQRKRDELIRWRPSIHMPRWASRITLEITDVRCQRLQDISEEDACAEGIQYDFNVDPIGPCRWRVPDTSMGVDSASGAFSKLWENINGPDAWDANPWVWALTFKRIE